MPSSIPEEAVRKFLELDWPNWKIARELKTSPTTVQRIRTKINTGPHPVLHDRPAERPGRGSLLSPAVLLAVALTVLAVIAAGALWAWLLRARAAPAGPSQAVVCVQISPAGNLTGLSRQRRRDLPAPVDRRHGPGHAVRPLSRAAEDSPGLR